MHWLKVNEWEFVLLLIYCTVFFIFIYFFSQITSQDLSEMILTMVANANVAMNKARQFPLGVVGAKLNQTGITTGQPNPVIVNVRKAFFLFFFFF